MSSVIRQFENAVNLLVEGTLRLEDTTETVRAVVDALFRVAGDWAENLPEGREYVDAPILQCMRERFCPSVLQDIIDDSDDDELVEYAKLIKREQTGE